LKVILEHVRVTDNGDVVALGWVPSDSDKWILYGVYIRMRGGRVVKSICTCKGYVFHGDCKHVIRLAAVTRQYVKAAYNPPYPQAAKH
jgi:hypothetical protein